MSANNQTLNLILWKVWNTLLTLFAFKLRCFIPSIFSPSSSSSSYFVSNNNKDICNHARCQKVFECWVGSVKIVCFKNINPCKSILKIYFPHKYLMSFKPARSKTLFNLLLGWEKHHLCSQISEGRWYYRV